MPIQKRPLNTLGRWLSQELDARNLQRSTFAKMVGTTPQNLADVMRGTNLSAESMHKWEQKFRAALYGASTDETPKLDETQDSA